MHLSSVRSQPGFFAGIIIMSYEGSSCLLSLKASRTNRLNRFRRTAFPYDRPMEIPILGKPFSAAVQNIISTLPLSRFPLLIISVNSPLDLTLCSGGRVNCPIRSREYYPNTCCSAVTISGSYLVPAWLPISWSASWTDPRGVRYGRG